MIGKYIEFYNINYIFIEVYPSSQTKQKLKVETYFCHLASFIFIQNKLSKFDTILTWLVSFTRFYNRHHDDEIAIHECVLACDCREMSRGCKEGIYTSNIVFYLCNKGATALFCSARINERARDCKLTICNAFYSKACHCGGLTFVQIIK